MNENRTYTALGGGFVGMAVGTWIPAAIFDVEGALHVAFLAAALAVVGVYLIAEASR